MSVLRAEKILDYLASPLSRCLKDESPYVRKTAALCVAKVFDLKPEMCVEYGFVETLRDMIGDGNPMVRNGPYLPEETDSVGRRERRYCPCGHSRSVFEPSYLCATLSWRIVSSTFRPPQLSALHHRPFHSITPSRRAQRML